jgi:two-component system NarL family sensor kinase
MTDGLALWPLASGRPLVNTVTLQFALRILLVVFIGLTLALEPPDANLWWCVLILAGYAAVVLGWRRWASRLPPKVRLDSRRGVALLVLTADLTALAVMSVLTAIASPDSWTSYVLLTGLAVVPLIAAAQLDPVVSGAIAVPTLATFVAVSWISQEANAEPWDSIGLSSMVLAGLACGSVALSLLQRQKVDTITELARQRTHLLEEMVGLEKRERQSLSERLHDGALQYVIVARQDVDEIRDGSHEATERVDSALAECSRLLRDVVRELHPEVLSRSGLKAALATLADSLRARSGLTVEFDCDSWPDDLRTDADYVMYGAAREIATNVVKHAHARQVRVDLSHADGQAVLRIADDGVGIPAGRLAESVQDGHIGMASIRAKVLACGGDFEVRTGSSGTQIDIVVPAR